MYFNYETDRLLMKILEPDSCIPVLDFYKRNKEFFEPYEPQKPLNYYTLDYQKKVLSSEYNSFLKLKYIRFFIMEKCNPNYIIGTISFSNFSGYPYHSCVVGYKFDHFYEKRGYASESMEKCISILFRELKIHRIEAYIMPNNNPSIRFIKRQGFQIEGINYKQIAINGEWEDHLRFSLINYGI